MPARPTIATIIINYNYARFVGHAIESALAQTDPFDEVVVVDDGSTDASAEVIGRYADRVTVVGKANGGQMTATLAGMAQISSDYVYVLDADDFASPGLVATIRPYLAAQPVKLQFQLISVDGDGEHLMSTFPSYVDGYDRAAMIQDNLRLGFYVCPPTAGNIYRRMTLESMKLDRLRPNEPLDGPPALAAPYMGEVVSLNTPLAYYRVHGRNVSRWDRPDEALLQGEIEWLHQRWFDVRAILGEAAPSEPVDPLYVTERRLMIAALGGGAPVAPLARRYMWALAGVHYRRRQKLALLLWALLLALPIPRLRAYLVRAKRSSVNRSSAVKWLLSALLTARPAALNS